MKNTVWASEWCLIKETSMIYSYPVPSERQQREESESKHSASLGVFKQNYKGCKSGMQWAGD